MQVIRNQLIEGRFHMVNRAQAKIYYLMEATIGVVYRAVLAQQIKEEIY